MATTSKKSKRPWIIALVVVIVIVLIVVAVGTLRSQSRSASTASTTLTSTVARGTVDATVTASGQIVNEYTYSVAAGSTAVLTEQDGVATNGAASSSGSSSTSGGSGYTTTKLDVKAGDTVKSGQRLAKATSSTSDATSLNIALASANAALSSAYSALSSDQSSYNSLVDDSKATTASINNARKQVSSDNASIASAKSAQAAAQSNVDAHSIAVDSPVAGQVLSVGTAVGASASPVAVIGAGTTEISIMVPEYRISSVELKQAVDITLGSSAAPFAGTVKRISPQSTDTSGVQEYQVIVTSNAIPATARVGMTLTASIEIASHKNVLHVPASAVTTSGGKSHVTVVDARGTQTVKTVGLGLVGDNSVEITSGLSAGDTVVTGAAGTVPAATTGGGRL